MPELSGATELRPVEPACQRNVLERFVISLRANNFVITF